jgi:hypothetical protein
MGVDSHALPPSRRLHPQPAMRSAMVVAKIPTQAALGVAIVKND